MVHTPHSSPPRERRLIPRTRLICSLIFPGRAGDWFLAPGKGGGENRYQSDRQALCTADGHRGREDRANIYQSVRHREIEWGRIRTLRGPSRAEGNGGRNCSLCFLKDRLIGAVAIRGTGFFLLLLTSRDKSPILHGSRDKTRPGWMGSLR